MTTKMITYFYQLSLEQFANLMC